MKMRPALFLLTFCLLIPPAAEDKKQNLKCDELRSTEVGEDVTLDCHHPKRLDVTGCSVYWKFNKGSQSEKKVDILVYRNRKISNVDQGEQFKSRASKDSSWNPAQGKLFLKISPVKAEDAGNYTCSVRCLKMCCSTNLSITPKSDGQRKAPDGNHGDQEDEEQNFMCDEQRSKEAGEDVTLDCHHPTGRDVTEESVYWKFNNIHVLVFRDRKISNVDQGEEFKGRASNGSSWNPAEGKLPLKISPVKAEDAGNYTCCITQQEMSCSTNLSITSKSDGPSKAPDGNHGNQGSDNSKMAIIGGSIVGIIGGGAIIGIICYIKCKKRDGII